MCDHAADHPRADLVRRLGTLDSCALADALDRLGLAGVVRGIRRQAGGARIAAPVSTVRLGIEDGRPRSSHLGAAALDRLRPGSALVIANGGRVRAACWGGLLTRAARARRSAGLIVDGAVRDVDEIDRLGVPVFARTAVPLSARGRFVELETNVGVVLDGIDVAPGDLVLADGSGVLFVPLRRAEQVIGVAEEIMAREAEMARALEAGRSAREVLGGDYERLTGG